MGRALWLVGLAAFAALLLGARALWLSATYVSIGSATVEGETVTVAAPAEARIVQIAVETGQQVRAGEVLARLDRETLDLGVRQAEAGLLTSKATLERTQAELEVARRQAVSDATKAQAALRSAQVSLDQAGTQSEYRSASQPERARQAEAELAQAQAELELAEKSRPELIAQSRADLAEAQAVAGKAESDLSRYENLNQRGFVSKSELDGARFTRDVAEARLAAAKERLTSVETGSQAKLVEVAQQHVASARAALAVAKAGSYDTANSRQEIVRRQAELGQATADLVRASSVSTSIKPREDAVAAAAAEVEGAKAGLAVARKALAEGDIRSPVSGVIVEKQTHQGELVARGAPLFTVLDRNRPCWVMARVSEYQIVRVKPGQPAIVYIRAYPRRVFRGRVLGVGDVAAARNSGSASAGSRDRPAGSAAEVPVKLSVENEGLRMVPRTSARVRIRVR